MKTLRGLIIDDAVLMRRLVAMVFERSPGIEAAGVAQDGPSGLRKLSSLRPDFVTLDVEMPGMNGIETLRQIRRIDPDLPVIMLSAATSKGAAVTLDALAAGASDYVTKPTQAVDLADSVQQLTDDLVPKVRALCSRPTLSKSSSKAPVEVSRERISFRSSKAPPQLLCIGTSTGGPNALAQVFRQFTQPPPVPVVIVQHMPPTFTKMLAERLGRGSRGLPCKEAECGEVLKKGHAYMAPGGRHLVVESRKNQFRARLVDTPPENSCRPAVDVLFRSAAKAGGAGILGVILTGMGRDGTKGGRHLIDAGSRLIAQDEASSVVWGMPGSVVEAGLVEGVYPLARIHYEIVRRLGVSHPQY